MPGLERLQRRGAQDTEVRHGCIEKVRERFVWFADWQNIQGKYLAALLRSHGKTVHNRVAMGLARWPLFHTNESQDAVRSIPFQQPLALQKPAG